MAAIVLIVVGSLLIVSGLLYLVWPMLSSLWSGSSESPASDPEPKQLSREAKQRVGAELPPLLTPA